MPNVALVSLAILKVNWDRLGRDYIENFVPFVAEALRQTSGDVVSLPDLQETIRGRFGLDLPLNPLRQILKRAAKRGLVRRQSGVFYREAERLNESNFSEVRGIVVSIHDRILSRLRDFARGERGTVWSEEEAAAALQSFLSAQSLRFLYAQVERAPLVAEGIPKDAAYTVASFLASARESDPQTLEDFTMLVKGHLLAGAIYHRDTGRVAQRFGNTRIYLDTSVVVFAAGYAGPERQAPCEELVS